MQLKLINNNIIDFSDYKCLRDIHKTRILKNDFVVKIIGRNRADNFIYYTKEEYASRIKANYRLNKRYGFYFENFPRDRERALDILEEILAAYYFDVYGEKIINEKLKMFSKKGFGDYFKFN